MFQKDVSVQGIMVLPVLITCQGNLTLQAILSPSVQVM